jgi:muramoyltetrapeptide carboxypeptidase
MSAQPPAERLPPSAPALRRGPALQTGDRVAVIAPSSPFDREKFERGVKALTEIGLEPAFGEGLFSRHPAGEAAYLAGADGRRLAELRGALLDPAARLVVLARGGYGLLRLLGRGEAGSHADARPAGARSTALPADPLSVQEIAAAGKLLLGYSDATVLHELWARAGVPSIHGPMCSQLGEEPLALERLRALLTGTDPRAIAWDPIQLPGVDGGRAEGVLRGGNLATLASLCGTALQPSFDGCLVLLEDLNEPPYRLDRLVTQLLLSGALTGARGFVIGDLWTQGEQPRGRAEVLAERLSALGVPLAFGAPFGHAGRNQPVAFGCVHALDARGGRLLPLEGPTVPRATALLG